MFITRRPQDIPSKFVESCHYKLIYTIEGKNVKRYLSDIDSDIQDLMPKLSFQRHNFIYKEQGKPPILHNAVPLT